MFLNLKNTKSSLIILSIIFLTLSFSNCRAEDTSKEEAALLEQNSKYVKKILHGYKISCKNNKNIIFKDVLLRESVTEDEKNKIIDESKEGSVVYNEDQIKVTDAADGTEGYIFDHYFSDIGYLGFKKFYYEDMSYEMVNLETCEDFSLAYKPQFSPDKKHIFAGYYSEVYSYGFIGIYEFGKEGIKMKKEFRALPIYFEGWIDSNAAKFSDVDVNVQSFDKKTPTEFILYYDKKSQDWIFNPVPKAVQ